MSEQIWDSERVLTPTRRVFLKGMLAAGGALVLNSWEAIDSTELEPSNEDNVDQPATEIDTSNPLTNPLESLDEELQDHDQITETIKDSATVSAAGMAVAAIMNTDTIGLYSGNSGFDHLIEKYRQNRLKMLFYLTVVAPVAEETVFRGIPGAFNTHHNLMPVTGLVSTYLFGKMHQLKRESSSSRLDARNYYFDQNMIPVPQYALGAFYWMVARRQGLGHSMVAHATTNVMASVSIELISRMK